MVATLQLYSPVGDNGFQPQSNQHNPRQDPEDFYRALPANLDTSTGGDHDHSVSPVSPNSPADSQAPIMGVGQAQEYPPPPMVSYPPPPTVAEESYPLPQAMPAVNNYRTSMGVVNGEVGGVPPIPAVPQGTRRDPYAGLSVPMTPLTPALKTPTFKEDASVDRYSQKVQKYDKKDLVSIPYFRDSSYY